MTVKVIDMAEDEMTLKPQTQPMIKVPESHSLNQRSDDRRVID